MTTTTFMSYNGGKAEREIKCFYENSHPVSPESTIIVKHGHGSDGSGFDDKETIKRIREGEKASVVSEDSPMFISRHLPCEPQLSVCLNQAN